MNRSLRVLFSGIFVLMIGVTTWASLESNVLEGFSYVFRDRWAIATLADALFGFLTFYAWVFYKESRWTSRMGWLVAILALGNIAMAFYMLRLLMKLGPNARPEDILLRKVV